MGRGLAVGRSDSLHSRKVKDAFIISCHAEFDVGHWAEVAEGHHLNVVLSSHAQELLLGEVRVHFDLKDGRLDLSVAENLTDHGSANIAEANVADKTLSDQLFHGLPGLLVRDTVVDDHARLPSVEFFVKADPLRGVKLVNRYEGLSDWEMNQVEVQVVDTEVSHRFLAGELHVLRPMESVPELGHNEEIFPLHNTLIDGLLHALSRLLFVAIVTSGVQESVSVLDCVVNDIGAGVTWHLPKSKSELGELVTAAEDKVCRGISHWLRALADRSEDFASSIEGLSGVVRHSVVDDDKLAGAPSVSACILCHVGGQIGEHVVWHRGVITEDYGLFRVVSRIDPTGVGSNDLVEEGLVPV